MDTNIIVWDIQNSGEHPIIIRGAHAMSPVCYYIPKQREKMFDVDKLYRLDWQKQID